MLASMPSIDIYVWMCSLFGLRKTNEMEWNWSTAIGNEDR